MLAEPTLIGFDEPALDEIKTFGDRLIITGDLDPVYIAIYGAQLTEPQLCRLLLAYMMFYHLGVAAWLSEHEGVNYWKQARAAAENLRPAPIGGRWPRSAERRHFRGIKCVDAVDWFSARMPEDYIRPLAGLRTEMDVMTAVKRWPMFGDWVAYKVADLIDRVYGVPLIWSTDVVLLYDSPRKALDALDAGEPKGVFGRLMEYFSRHAAPPRYDRPCGPAEVETVCCKYGSMHTGHYHVGKDIHEIRRGLLAWGSTAQRLLAAMPQEVRY